jgi:MoaA/NifB/PqqE/SkfB family radical SAM enzyme
LAQVIITRRRNLSCGYCTEYDKTFEPVPFDAVRRRLELLRDLRTWAVSLMGGEPTLHPDLLKIFSTMRDFGFHRRMMTTNGLLLTKQIVDGLNNSGMTDMSLSVDGVKRNATTRKVLNVLRRKRDTGRECAIRRGCQRRHWDCASRGSSGGG